MDYAPVFRKLGVPRNLSFLGGGYPGNAPKRGDTKMAKNDPPNLTPKMPSKKAPKNPIPGNPKNPISWGGGEDTQKYPIPGDYPGSGRHKSGQK